jgi:hypothetical protein
MINGANQHNFIVMNVIVDYVIAVIETGFEVHFIYHLIEKLPVQNIV